MPRIDLHQDCDHTAGSQIPTFMGPTPSRPFSANSLPEESPAEKLVSSSIANLNFTHACLCLNVRIWGTGKPSLLTRTSLRERLFTPFEVEKIYIIHPKLVDTIFCERTPNWMDDRCLVTCLFCQTLVYAVAFEPHHRTQFSVTTLMGDSGYIFGPPPGLTGAHIAESLRSPYFSPTFQILLSVPSFKSRSKKKLFGSGGFSLYSVDPHRIDSVHENLIYSEFSAMAIRRCQELRARLAKKPGTAYTQGVERRIRSDLEMFIRQLYDRQVKGRGVRNSLKATLTQFMAPLDLELSKQAQSFNDDPIARLGDSFCHDLNPLALMDKTLSSSPRHSLTYRSHAVAFSGDHPTATRNFADLPTELALIIFSHTNPVFRRPEHPLIAFSDYYRKRSCFARLALVSRSWAPLISDVLYCTLVVSFKPATRSLPLAIERHGSRVDTFIIDGTVRSTFEALREYSVVIERCLALSTVSSIEFYDMHNQYIFNKLHWLQQIAPLCTSVKSFTYYSAEPHAFLELSLWLLGLGRNLESLNVQDWCYSHSSSSSFAIPKKMRHLKHVVVKDGNPPAHRINKLLSRAYTTRWYDGRRFKESSLRQLSISEVQTLEETAIIDILHINDIRFQLTSLRVRLPQSREVSSEVWRLPLRLLELCTSLVDFSYTSPAPPEIFMHLPLSLQNLELAIVIFDTIITSEPASIISSTDSLVNYLQLDRSPNSNLRSLSVIWRKCTGFVGPTIHWQRNEEPEWRRLNISWSDDHNELQSVCNDVGISLDCAFWFDVFHFP